MSEINLIFIWILGLIPVLSEINHIMIALFLACHSILESGRGVVICIIICNKRVANFLLTSIGDIIISVHNGFFVNFNGAESLKYLSSIISFLNSNVSSSVNRPILLLISCGVIIKKCLVANATSGMCLLLNTFQLKHHLI